MRIRLYPRPRDQQIVYLKDVIESPRGYLKTPNVTGSEEFLR